MQPRTQAFPNSFLRSRGKNRTAEKKAVREGLGTRLIGICDSGDVMAIMQCKYCIVHLSRVTHAVAMVTVGVHLHDKRTLRMEESDKVRQRR